MSTASKQNMHADLRRFVVQSQALGGVLGELGLTGVEFRGLGLTGLGVWSLSLLPSSHSGSWFGSGASECPVPGASPKPYNPGPN